MRISLLPRYVNASSGATSVENVGVCAERCLHATTVSSVVNILSSYGFGVLADKIPEAICSQVARLLREEREKRGLSRNLLAEKAGLARQTVTFVEQELRNPTLDTLLRLTLALEVDLEKIIARARKVASTKGK